MTKKLLITFSFGQSLSIGTTTEFETLSPTPQHPGLVLGLDFGNVQTNGRGFRGEAVRTGDFKGFIDLIEADRETPASGMLNQIVDRYLADGRDPPSIVHFHAGQGGRSIVELLTSASDIFGSIEEALAVVEEGNHFAVAQDDGSLAHYVHAGGEAIFTRDSAGGTVYFDNLVTQLELTVQTALDEGFEIEPSVVLNWIQGQSDVNLARLETFNYEYHLNLLLDKVSAVIADIVSPDANLVASISQFRGTGLRATPIQTLEVINDRDDAHLGIVEYAFQAFEPAVIGRDYTHLSSEGYYRAGRVLGERIYDVLNNDENQPILIERIEQPATDELLVTFSGLEIGLVNDPSIYRAETGLTPPPNFGFELYLADGTPGRDTPSIIKSEIIGLNQVRLTFDQPVAEEYRLFLGRTRENLIDPAVSATQGRDFGGTTLRDALETSAPNPTSQRQLDDNAISEYAPVQAIQTHAWSVFGSDASDELSGTPLNDSIAGNAGADLILGDTGNDTIDGGDGEDTAIFAGNRSDYTVTQITRDGFTIEGPDGTDTLTAIEFAQFDDETIRLEPRSPTVFDEPNVDIFNEELIFGDVLLSAPGIQFINTAQGQVLGQVTFGVGGSTITNQRGGTIGEPDENGLFTQIAVQGSEGGDTLFNFGQIVGIASLGGGNDQAAYFYNDGFNVVPGEVDLGAGDDILRLEGNDPPIASGIFTAEGGSGFDTFEVNVTSGAPKGSDITGFESLIVFNSDILNVFDGYLEISADPNNSNFVFFEASNNPDAAVNLSGSRWFLSQSTVGTVTGTDGSEEIGLIRGSRVLGDIDFGGGDDRIVLLDSPFEFTSVDGGDGDGDEILIESVSSLSQDFSDFTGFEVLTVANRNRDGATEDFNLSGLSDLTAVTIRVVDFDKRINVTFSGSDIPEAMITGREIGTVTLDSQTTIGGFEVEKLFTGDEPFIAEPLLGNNANLLNAGTILGDVSFFSGNDIYDGQQGTIGGDVLGDSGNDILLGGAGEERFFGGDNRDRLNGGGGNDVLDGGRDVDVAIFSGNRADYTVTQTSLGVFEVSGPDGTDTLTAIEFARFDDERVRLRPGEGVAVNFDPTDPSSYQDAMNAIRDFNGNQFSGGDGGWRLIGSTDVNGDGDVDQILVNDAIGRFATVGTADDGLVYFDDHGWAGETRVAGIYIDPLVRNGTVEQGGPFDSQQRFRNDLRNDNIGEALGSDDYNGDGIWEVFFALNDGTAYLRALMHADGNIRYANYRSEEQVRSYLEANGFGEETFGDWFAGADASSANPNAAALASEAMMWQPQDMGVVSEFFG